jgi:Xaa-Pro aminopeptidase
VLLRPVSRNPIDAVWGRDRPRAPAGPIEVHGLEHAGLAAGDKIAAVQKQLREARQHALVLSTTDNICWLLNIRGSDVAHNPVVLAHMVVPATGKPDLFVALDKVTAEARAHLAPLVKTKPPEALPEALAALRATGKPIRLASGSASWWTFRTLGGGRRVVRGPDPCAEMKTVKNATEIAGARTAHLRDGRAVTRFLAWLDRAVAAGPVDEIGAVEQLETLRRETGSLREISFPTISGSGPNGAIVHYRVTRATNRTLGAGELFLIDSGGQYADGTTDITRTVAIGTPSREMAERFTLVLQGMIAISTARFPRGTRGIDLDPFARRALWARGLAYDHGTGHGVGSYLNVHEGPPSISKAGTAELKPGMILSNEPGYYKAGAYGIRIENLLLVGDAEPVEGGDCPVMGFETLTLAPIDRRLIVPAMLSPEERAWIDAYHARVRTELSPGLDRAARTWLAAATARLEP